MSCCGLRRSKTLPPSKLPSNIEHAQEPRIKTTVKREVVLKISECQVHLIDQGEALQLAAGDFTLLRVSDDEVSLAVTIKVGDELQWPLTKDEPVVKLDALHYLFSLPTKDGTPLSYGVTFTEKGHALSLLDSFLAENALFTAISTSSSSRKEGVKWKEFAPAVEDYKGVLAKAIAGGSGHVVKGIFKVADAYSDQVQKGGQAILIRAAEDEKNPSPSNKTSKTSANTKAGAVNRSLSRVRKLSGMTEKLSKAMLDAVGIASGSVMAPLVQSHAGKSLLSSVPAEVILASLDAVNKIIDAAEAAQKQALASTSTALTSMATAKFGESAGEATEDVLATAGHCAGTAWNVFKIRKALNPVSSAGVVKGAAKHSKRPYM